jgi:hypothetical protein
MNKFKIHIFIISIILIPSVALCFSLTDIFTANHLDWDFIQNVGGLEVSDPEYKLGEGWYLPVKCDVSGLQFITTKPTALNSTLATKGVKAQVKDNKIQIWVISCLVSKNHPNPVTRGVQLKNIKNGKYQIEYLNKDGTSVLIKEVEFKQ